MRGTCLIDHMDVRPILWFAMGRRPAEVDVASSVGAPEAKRSAVDALYGNTVLPERPGYASGPYEYDVSPFLAGIILGREWESCAVKGFNELNRRETGARRRSVRIHTVAGRRKSR